MPLVPAGVFIVLLGSAAGSWSESSQNCPAENVLFGSVGTVTTDTSPALLSCQMILVLRRKTKHKPNKPDECIRTKRKTKAEIEKRDQGRER